VEKKVSTQSPVIALITNDVVGECMAGPGIRYWEFARILGQHFSVKLIVPPFVPMEVIPSAETLPASLCVCSNAQTLRDVAQDCDVIVTLGVVLLFYPFIGDLGKPLVLDMYDPFLLENLQRQAKVDLLKQVTSYENYLEALRVQLCAGDFFMCAGEKQRDYWLGMLAAMGRVNPYTYRQDPTLRHLIDIVPFGLPGQSPQHAQPVLKGVYKSIKADDKVILWGGGIWEWLDAPTLIKAVPYILERRNDIKVFFMGIKRSNQDSTTIKAVDEAVTLSKELGLYDKYVFFNDWVPYNERQNYLLEADIGVSLHLDHIEARFAFRTRLLDYLWAGLPVVCTEGDVIGETLAVEGLAHMVPSGDSAQVARTILGLLEIPNLRTDCIARSRELATAYRWDTLTRPLVDFCSSPFLAPDKDFLRQRRLSETFIRPGPVSQLLAKSWRALRLGGVPGMLEQAKEYVRWKMRH
jgi:glycosyltransferase involved in cell wall biosynthesis